MKRRPRVAVVAALLLVTAAIAAATAGRTPPPRPVPAGSWAFAAFGDAPYRPQEEVQYPLTLADVDAHPLAFVLHVGDILGAPCTDERYRKTLAWWARVRHPLIYTPGDNEWADCWGPAQGGFAPLERLQRLRQLFFPDPTRSLGPAPIALESQRADPAFSEYVENARFVHQGMVFATVHLVGSKNARVPFPEQTPEDLLASIRRTKAAAAWLRATFAEAHTRGAAALVVAFQAYPFFERPVSDEHRQAFEPFMLALEEEVERFGRPVLAIHGDYHRFLVDHPLHRRTTGVRLENFTRLMVPGSPNVGWVVVRVTPGVANPFAFERRVLSRWRLW